jgi:hypothetical protein
LQTNVRGLQNGQVRLYPLLGSKRAAVGGVQRGLILARRGWTSSFRNVRCAGPCISRRGVSHFKRCKSQCTRREITCEYTHWRLWRRRTSIEGPFKLRILVANIEGWTFCLEVILTLAQLKFLLVRRHSRNEVKRHKVQPNIFSPTPTTTIILPTHTIPPSPPSLPPSTTAPQNTTQKEKTQFTVPQKGEIAHDITTPVTPADFLLWEV